MSASVWQARYAQPLVVRNYSQLVPPHRTPLPGVFIASMAQVYPEDRGTNYAIRDGRKVARMVEEFLGSKARATPSHATSDAKASKPSLNTRLTRRLSCAYRTEGKIISAPAKCLSASQ